MAESVLSQSLSALTEGHEVCSSSEARTQTKISQTRKRKTIKTQHLNTAQSKTKTNIGKKPSGGQLNKNSKNLKQSKVQFNCLRGPTVEQNEINNSPTADILDKEGEKEQSLENNSSSFQNPCQSSGKFSEQRKRENKTLRKANTSRNNSVCADEVPENSSTDFFTPLERSQTNLAGELSLSNDNQLNETIVQQTICPEGPIEASSSSEDSSSNDFLTPLKRSHCKLPAKLNLSNDNQLNDCVGYRTRSKKTFLEGLMQGSSNSFNKTRQKRFITAREDLNEYSNLVAQSGELLSSKNSQFP